MKVNKKSLGLAAGLATAFVGAGEGLRQVAYLDPVGIPTVCFGETRGVKLGQKYSKEECQSMLRGRLEEFNAGIETCITRPLTDTRRVAFVSFAYNVGVRTFCNSSVARLHNQGSDSACDALLAYNKARKAGVLIPLPGLTTRRKEERELCYGRVPTKYLAGLSWRLPSLSEDSLSATAMLTMRPKWLDYNWQTKLQGTSSTALSLE